ncbi:protein CROWDED NUCLEI 4-like, partial [Neltuma alba]
MATPSPSAQPLSITPRSRVRSPLSDDEIWLRLKRAGLDEESIKQKDKAALVAYIAKLEAEIYDHQHHMGLLILERKELASKYEQLKASTESSELFHKRDLAMQLSALAEARKREENLKKTVEVKKECIASLEKALGEMRSECAETKVAADSKFAEAHRLIDEAQKKFTEAEANVRAAECLQAEASRYNSVAERKLRDVEAREDDLRRRTISFKS